MTIKFGIPTSIPVANCNDLAKAQEADTNHDGAIDLKEAMQSYAADMVGEKIASVTDAYRVFGGSRHTVRSYLCPDWRGAYGGGAYSYATMFRKGDFYVEDFGAGVVSTRNNYHYRDNDYQQPPVTSILFVIDCDMFSQEFISRIDLAQLVLGPKGLPTLAGSDLEECVTVPLDVFTAPEEKGHYEGSGKAYLIPAKRILIADVNSEDLTSLAGSTGGVSFFVQVTLNDGQTVDFYKEGVRGCYFELKTTGSFPMAAG